MAEGSGATIWRWLAADAIRPWCHRGWIFPATRTFGPRRPGGSTSLRVALRAGACIRAIAIRRTRSPRSTPARVHEGLAPGPGEPGRLEREYERMGPLCYLAAWDVRRARVIGPCEERSGIEPFDRLWSSR